MNKFIYVIKVTRWISLQRQTFLSLIKLRYKWTKKPWMIYRCKSPRAVYRCHIKRDSG